MFPNLTNRVFQKNAPAAGAPCMCPNDGILKRDIKISQPTRFTKGYVGEEKAKIEN